MPFQVTFGYELELGDVLRDRVIPEQYGTWEHAETDIVNVIPPYQYIAADPLGKSPPVGGEINIRPGHSPVEVATRVVDTINWFRRQGDQPSASCMSHGHVHVRVKGLRDDIRALKRATNWIVRNQDYLIKRVHAYQELPAMERTKAARTYLKWDGARPMPYWMGQNIIKHANTFDDFIRIQCCGKDGLSMGRPFRYAVNTYCMKHIDTIEFRLFRGSLRYDEIVCSLELARHCLEEAVRDGEDVEKFLGGYYPLAPFHYDLNTCAGWEKTRWGKERGHKERHLLDL